jgi:hypothetical protein
MVHFNFEVLCGVVLCGGVAALNVIFLFQQHSKMLSPLTEICRNGL